MADARTEGREYIKGLVIMAGLVGLALLIFFLGDLLRIGQESYRIVAVFPEAPRLRPGSPVWLAGRASGQVLDVDMLPPSADTLARIAAVIEIPEDARPYIRRDSELRLGSPRLIGEPVIQLDPGSSASPILREGDTIRATVSASPMVLLAQSRTLLPAFDSLMASVQELNRRMSRQGGPASRPSFERMQREVAAARIEFQRFTQQMQTGPMGQFAGDAEVQASIGRIRAAMTELPRAFAQARERWAGTTAGATTEARALGPGFRGVMDHVTELRAEIGRLQTMMAQQGGFAYRMAQDTALQKAIAGTQAQLDSLIAEVKRNPLMFVF